MNQLNTIEFIQQGGLVSMAVAMILVVMSLASWYFIVVKAVQNYRQRSLIQKTISAFWAAPHVQAGMHQSMDSPALQLAKHAVASAQHHQAHAPQHMNEACSFDEFVARNIRRSLTATQTELESGLSVLASVGSVAPFVGLFGTVWGIYHALASISASGQATLDKVAGPVGEALIMTAIGLAVAIPAVLAYNAFIKQNRVIMGQLENFAQDLHTLLTIGAPLMMKKASKDNAPVAINTAKGVPA
ncbi:MAG: MotA/TolQ/ExbB proton channel family protein [Methylophilus sp.]|nr:MotA/TolQ/ExbB proton channel family protein [Methylophilus sp.]